MADSKDFVYSGGDNLEAMKEAKNYNNYLIGIITDALKLSSSDHKVVLDFGSGLGTFADMLKESQKDLTIECLEPDATMQKTLKDKGYAIVADSTKLPKNHYDVIYALNVFEHIKDDHGAIEGLYDALKPGGALVIYVPAFPILFSSMDELVGHHRRYKKDRMHSLAGRSKLTPHKIVYCDPLGFAVSLMFRFVGSKDGTITPASVRMYDKYLFPLSRVLEPVFKNIGGKNVLMVAVKK